MNAIQQNDGLVNKSENGLKFAGILNEKIGILNGQTRGYKMEYANKPTREIRYFSAKNNREMIVHTEPAKDYAELLENNIDVASYETCKLLDINQYDNIPTLEMRTELFGKTWTSDFVIYMKNGEVSVRELCYRQNFLRKMNLQRLEFSRRYWQGLGIDDWKIVLT